ncbi:BMP family ABC transporter substrate-binding protein [Actinoplanes bogorensis]|uniref:BMP family ABC transporter substrate-binding protein n=1 Tax=Paractinoplanes bogorensis TaxID=1610840 RepID=A0ABS5YVX2_9ACTN|nr:BMP family ABC transporter substrate-binding protein [Actinoplanes bogorensis]MBU2667221.1 BMP family ABC transporter substrate-binding protein [Actinoplanes bogorensis]
MRVKLAIISFTTAIPVLLAGCGSGDEAAGTAAAGESSTINIGFLAPAPRNDGGFTQYALAGVQAAVDADPKLKLTSIVDNASESQEQIEGLQSLAAKNKVVVADGAVLNKAVAVVAPKYPDTHFVLIASDLEALADNVSSVTVAVGLNAMVAGAVASNESKSKKIGMIAGPEVPSSTAWYYGMAQGAKIENPQTQVAQAYTNDYNDVGKAKQAAEAMIANGVDQILSDLDSGSEGIYQAADGKAGTGVYNVFALHCDENKNIIGSGIVNWSDVLKTAVTEAAAGKLASGAISFGLKSGALSFQFCPGKGTDEQKALAEKITKDISDGTVTPGDGVLLPKPSYAFEQR